MKKIKFKGEEYIFGGDDLDEGHFIATEDQYMSGKISFAHLCLDGRIIRFKKVIGDRSDIEVLEEGIEIIPSEGAFSNLLLNYLGES